MKWKETFDLLPQESFVLQQQRQPSKPSDCFSKCSCSYKIGCFLSPFDVWCDNELVCLHMHGTQGTEESGTSWMFHDLRANVWMFGTPQVPKQFKMNAHKKIADRLSSYCGNITRRAKQKAGCWRHSSFQAWLPTHNVTTNTSLMLQSTEHSTQNFLTGATFRATLALKEEDPKCWGSGGLNAEGSGNNI